MRTNFNVKIISGNMVLVESQGFSPEIFIPVFRKNRIVFLNIIESRRCRCENIQPKRILNGSSLNKTQSTINNDVTNQVSEIVVLSPPDLTRRCREINVETPIKFQRNISDSPSNIFSKSPINQFKVVQLYRNPTKNSPKRAGKLIVTQKINPARDMCNENSYLLNPAFSENIGPVAFSENDFATPLNENPNEDMCLLNPAFNENVEPVVFRQNNFSTPPNKNLRTYKAQNGKSRKTETQIPKTITKWRKCITPLRTYSKKKITRTPLQNIKGNQPPTPRVVPIENIDLPDYIRNPTAGICGDALLIIKKKKLIKDPKVNINGRIIKEQLVNTLDLQQKNLFLPKRKLEFNNSVNGQPYELLTNLCRKNVSSKLKQMFKTRCIKKNCPSRPNYLKLIGKIPELENQIIKSNEICGSKRLEPRKLIV